LLPTHSFARDRRREPAGGSAGAGPADAD